MKTNEIFIYKNQYYCQELHDKSNNKTCIVTVQKKANT